MLPSDKKKLLALPFFLAKRSQPVEPRRGQSEFNLFNTLTGKGWYDNEGITIDDETKITEFEYENYLNQHLLKNLDTKSNEFKRYVRSLNLFTVTDYEKTEDVRTEYQHLMPVLRNLDEQE